MITLNEAAYAKLNLTLDVLDKRPDGYHNLQSIMQAVSIRDDIEIDVDTGKPWALHCDKENIPCDESNLAWKAARVFCDAMNWEPDGLEIRITKRIPSEAGLGGGSADAAAVLRALNRHLDYPLSLPALAELGAKVGSDVPFCVLCGTALVEGRGERITALTEVPECFYVVCKPDLSFSTPELYGKLDGTVIAKRPNTTAMRAALQRKDLTEMGLNLCNVFEQVTIPEYPELNYIKSILMTYGAFGSLMTGSGSAVFGMFDNFEYAVVACTMLKENYPQVFICKTV